MSSEESGKNEQKIVALAANADRVERILEKVAENHNQLAIICTEIKIMNETQSARITSVEREHRRAEEHRGQALEGIYRKIDESEEKNENKIDRTVSILSEKIDDLAKSYNARIDQLAEEIKKLQFLKYSTLGAWALLILIVLKFNVMSSVLSFLGN